MKQELNINVPTSWEDLSLKTYLKFQQDSENYKDNDDAVFDLMIHHFCGINLDAIRGISVDSYNLLKEKFTKFEKPEDCKLKRIIEVNGVEYGFEPNLSKMSYGAYLDIAKYDTITIDKNWGKIMDILYRPVTNKTGALYEIKSYDGDINEDRWMSVGMDVHFGTLFFFSDLLKDLVNSTQKSLKEVEGISHNIKSILERSGNPTLQ